MADAPDTLDQQLIAAGKAYRRADEVLKQRRAALHQLMFVAIRKEKTKSHVARLTGFTREHVSVLFDADEKRRIAIEAAQSAEAAHDASSSANNSS